ncbi:hypothetical protein [Oscillatoria sp. FACHB-1406]|uniref:hypothetical protein n=1 Tax=Oscillatoria sp. FACHB-1406 TaxID=2692846 RepID=UPI0016842982|nr:hypothetical protein [Oscillatoria sp. FACHB-1406]MBD2577676.1 hypothetical protein [Oscillatoria sp. FACHB-1406]
MFGTFQQTQLRIEVDASARAIGDSLLLPRELRKWLFPQNLDSALPERLQEGVTFSTWLGPVAVYHQVQIANDHCLRLLLSKGIDGYHEWYWGNGWVQSRLEGISLLPLNLGHSLSLYRLREFVAVRERDR